MGLRILECFRAGRGDCAIAERVRAGGWGGRRGIVGLLEEFHHFLRKLFAADKHSTIEKVGGDLLRGKVHETTFCQSVLKQQEQAMFVAIRVIIIVVCAYAGSALAALQFCPPQDQKRPPQTLLDE